MLTSKHDLVWKFFILYISFFFLFFIFSDKPFYISFLYYESVSFGHISKEITLVFLTVRSLGMFQIR